MRRAARDKSEFSSVLVTGAGGFVGRHVVAALIAAGWRADAIIAATHQDDKARAHGVRMTPLDIASENSVRAAIALAAPSVIIHLAAIAAPRRAAEDSARALDINFHGVKRIADAALESSPATRIIFASTSEVYGASFIEADGAPLREDAPLAPRGAYAESKAAADEYLGGLARQGADIIRIRPFNHTGPGQSPDFVVPAFAQQIARIEAGLQPPVVEVGNLDARRDFLDVRDVARAYALAAAPERPARAAIYNIASGTAHRIGDLLDRLIALSSTRIEVRPDPARMRGPETPIAIGDASLAAKELGWRPTISLDTTLRDTLDDWRARTRP